MCFCFQMADLYGDLYPMKTMMRALRPFEGERILGGEYVVVRAV